MVRSLVISVAAGAFLLAGSPIVRADDIELPRPCLKCGKPLMQVLQDRRSSREFSEKKLSVLRLASVLWAAFGVNREDGKRTAPSAMNWQEIEVYAFIQEGVYLYDAKAHKLVQVLDSDLRGQTGEQSFVGKVPLNLVYVADLDKMAKAKPEDKLRYAAMDTGFVAQNVYLHCASAGLATVARGSVDRDKLKKLLGLRPGQEIMLAQSVGYPNQEKN